MLLLVVDTSGRNGSVALARAQQSSDNVQVIESGTFSAQLVPQISGLIQKHGFRKTQVDGFIVVSGPGSFTGLRVGLAAIKALAEILDKPIVAVSLLEAIAFASGARGRILVAMDAGRGELYAGNYEVAAGSITLLGEQLQAREEFLQVAHDLTVATADAGIAEWLRSAAQPVCTLIALSSEIIARLGWKMLREGQTIAPDQLDANYLRRTGAELFAKPASSS
jgi:tRNA threonylcarbamoyladenosine biosynthesis protein TsaB